MPAIALVWKRTQDTVEALLVFLKRLSTQLVQISSNPMHTLLSLLCLSKELHEHHPFKQAVFFVARDVSMGNWFDNFWLLQCIVLDTFHSISI